MSDGPDTAFDAARDASFDLQDALTDVTADSGDVQDAAFDTVDDTSFTGVVADRASTEDAADALDAQLDLSTDDAISRRTPRAARTMPGTRTTWRTPMRAVPPIWFPRKPAAAESGKAARGTTVGPSIRQTFPCLMGSLVL